MTQTCTKIARPTGASSRVRVLVQAPGPLVSKPLVLKKEGIVATHTEVQAEFYSVQVSTPVTSFVHVAGSASSPKLNLLRTNPDLPQEVQSKLRFCWSWRSFKVSRLEHLMLQLCYQLYVATPMSSHLFFYGYITFLRTKGAISL